MDFRKAGPEDITELARLASALWDGHTTEELEKELSEILNSGEKLLFLWPPGRALFWGLPSASCGMTMWRAHHFRRWDI